MTTYLDVFYDILRISDGFMVLNTQTCEKVMMFLEKRKKAYVNFLLCFYSVGPQKELWPVAGGLD